MELGARLGADEALTQPASTSVALRRKRWRRGSLGPAVPSTPGTSSGGPAAISLSSLPPSLEVEVVDATPPLQTHGGHADIRGQGRSASRSRSRCRDFGIGFAPGLRNSARTRLSPRHRPPSSQLGVRRRSRPPRTPARARQSSVADVSRLPDSPLSRGRSISANVEYPTAIAPPQAMATSSHGSSAAGTGALYNAASSTRADVPAPGGATTAAVAVGDTLSSQEARRASKGRLRTWKPPCFSASEVAGLIGLHRHGPALLALVRCWGRHHGASLRSWQRRTGGVELPERAYQRHATAGVHAAVKLAARTGHGRMLRSLEENISAAVRGSGAPAELWAQLEGEALGRARMQRGTHLETTGLDAYELQFGRTVVRRNRDSLRRRFGTGAAAFVLAGRVDGFEETSNGRIVVEHKRRQRRLFKNAVDYEQVQCQIYMMLSDVAACRLVQTMGNRVDATLLGRCSQRWACIEGRLRAAARLLWRLSGGDGANGEMPWCPAPAELEAAQQAGWRSAPPWPDAPPPAPPWPESPNSSALKRSSTCVEPALLVDSASPLVPAAANAASPSLELLDNSPQPCTSPSRAPPAAVGAARVALQMTPTRRRRSGSCEYMSCSRRVFRRLSRARDCADGSFCEATLPETLLEQDESEGAGEAGANEAGGLEPACATAGNGDAGDAKPDAVEAGNAGIDDDHSTLCEEQSTLCDSSSEAIASDVEPDLDAPRHPSRAEELRQADLSEDMCEVQSGGCSATLLLPEFDVEPDPGEAIASGLIPFAARPVLDTSISTTILAWKRTTTSSIFLALISLRMSWTLALVSEGLQDTLLQSLVVASLASSCKTIFAKLQPI
eukprot:TRINITY_DN20049_c0_g2_i4.p1 TRINITY_DN20049_c0_g2~~TRINITY_DN20049_c0_g2_i4.p1  ORF type:complete len:866 (+),score=106.83 TRINITY_DN20049_c0_g2_i4:72-2600(+)